MKLRRKAHIHKQNPPFQLTYELTYQSQKAAEIMEKRIIVIMTDFWKIRQIMLCQKRKIPSPPVNITFPRHEKTSKAFSLEVFLAGL